MKNVQVHQDGFIANGFIAVADETAERFLGQLMSDQTFAILHTADQRSYVFRSRDIRYITIETAAEPAPQPKEQAR